ncbi:MAG: glycosyltransferase family 2 protein [Candidatus Hydrogenedentes bacterium]|nr:glycosyltransferase family 2 protein [Candidatus Hydrogenedentota bacterium]
MSSETRAPAPSRRYVLIMPTRDEEQFIQNTLDCVAKQTVLPVECVVVNDGSTDRTAEIADANAAQYPWLRVVHRSNRGERKVGGGVIDAFYAGYDTLVTNDYDYLCKLDADLTLPPDYFENIMKKLEEDPQLGSASGKVFNPSLGMDKLFEERIIDEQVSGAAKFYRRECFEDIGGLVREVMWDGIDFHRARMFGWKTRSFREPNLRILHHRLMGSSHKSIRHGRLRWGRGQWFMGTHPLYIIASGVFRMVERPFIIGGLLIIAGFFEGMIKGQPRYDDLWFRKNLHHWQLSRLGLGWLAARPEYASKTRGAAKP